MENSEGIRANNEALKSQQNFAVMLNIEEQQKELGNNPEENNKAIAQNQVENQTTGKNNRITAKIITKLKQIWEHKWRFLSYIIGAGCAVAAISSEKSPLAILGIEYTGLILLIISNTTAIIKLRNELITLREKLNINNPLENNAQPSEVKMLLKPMLCIAFSIIAGGIAIKIHYNIADSIEGTGLLNSKEWMAVFYTFYSFINGVYIPFITMSYDAEKEMLQSNIMRQKFKNFIAYIQAPIKQENSIIPNPTYDLAQRDIKLEDILDQLSKIPNINPEDLETIEKIITASNNQKNIIPKSYNSQQIIQKTESEHFNLEAADITETIQNIKHVLNTLSIMIGNKSSILKDLIEQMLLALNNILAVNNNEEILHLHLANLATTYANNLLPLLEEEKIEGEIKSKALELNSHIGKLKELLTKPQQDMHINNNEEISINLEIPNENNETTGIPLTHLGQVMIRTTHIKDAIKNEQDNKLLEKKGFN